MGMEELSIKCQQIEFVIKTQFPNTLIIAFKMRIISLEIGGMVHCGCGGGLLAFLSTIFNFVEYCMPQ